MAAVDIYELLHAGTDCFLLKEISEKTSTVLPPYQEGGSGTWYQVTAGAKRRGNYLKASGNSMLVHVMTRGIRLGLLNKEEWLSQVKKSHQGLLDGFALEAKKGWLNLNKDCRVAGLDGAEQRDGLYVYHISEPIICNDQKGVGAFLQALIEVGAL